MTPLNLVSVLTSSLSTVKAPCFDALNQCQKTGGGFSSCFSPAKTLPSKLSTEHIQHLEKEFCGLGNKRKDIK